MVRSTLRRLFLAAVLVASLVAVAPAALADEAVTAYSFVCQDVSPGRVTVTPSGVVQVRGAVLAGRTVSDDWRFNGDFVRRYSLDAYPDGSGVVWGVQSQKADGSDGVFALRFRVSFDTTTFGGPAAGPGRRSFSGQFFEGWVSPPGSDLPPNPCRQLLEVSQVTGVITGG